MDVDLDTRRMGNAASTSVSPGSVSGANAIFLTKFHRQRQSPNSIPDHLQLA